LILLRRQPHSVCFFTGCRRRRPFQPHCSSIVPSACKSAIRA
jgi:hypothetical protein